MGFKDEFKREMRNAMKDVEKSMKRNWTVDYKGHSIEVVFEMKEEQLIIDGSTVVSKKRKHFLSHLLPYSYMTGMIELEDGKKQKVSVKMGGYRLLNCIIKVDNEVILNDAQKLEVLPWEHKEKIVPYLQQQVQLHNKIVDESLPDDVYIYDEDQPKLIPGLADRMVEDITTPFYAKNLLKLFKEQIENPTIKTRKATYEKITSDHAVNYSNAFIELLLQAHLDETRVQEEALWLMENAAHREVLKFSIIALSCTDCEKYKDLLLTIGLHEEFTAYVVVALKYGMKNSNNEIWQLAKSVHGWGKIQAVPYIEANTEEIKHWIVTKGCENIIDNSYLAYWCAEKGELEELLSENTVSKELYNGVSVIVEGLLSETAPEGIDNYQYAGYVLSRYVHHASTHCKTMDDFYVLLKINEYMNVDSEDWDERYLNNWKQHERNAVMEAIQAIVGKTKWAETAVEKLKQAYDYKAIEIARFFEVDITEQLFSLVEKEPKNSSIYYAIMETNNNEYIAHLCQFAETQLSLTELSDEDQECLQCIVQSLHEYEGVGLSLIQAALQSNNGSLQYQSLTVLHEWTPVIWKKDEITTAIQRIATTAKDKEDRQLAKQLLAK